MTNRLSPGLTLRSFVLAVVFIVLGNIWLRYTGLIAHSGNFAESVPPIPAVAALLVMAIFNPFLRRWARRLALSQAEMITIYSMVAIAISMSSVGMIRYFLPVLTAPFYFATPENEYHLFQQYLPDWFVVKDRLAIVESYKGSMDGAVPWGAWILPLAAWTLFFVLFFWTMLCLVVIFRRQWMEHERLVFPVARFGLEIAQQDEHRNLIPAFFRNRLMWIGFGLAFAYNLLNILHAFFPAMPAPGKYVDIGRVFTDRPWSAMRPFAFQFRPAVFGLAYLMPLDVNFSVWFFYLAFKFVAVLISAFGANYPGFPFPYDQASGAYMSLVVVFVWAARRHLLQVLSRAFGNTQVDDHDEPFSYRVAFFGGLLGFIGICMWATAAGMALDAVLLFFGLLLGTALVYTKIRAEAGAPMIWLFPWATNKEVLFNILGPRYFMRDGSFRTMSIMASLAFLGRGYYPQFMAYQLESFRLTEDVRMQARRMAWAIMLALLVGLIAGYWMHLTTYYEYGANILEGGTAEWGGTRGAALIRQEYSRMHRLLGAAGDPNMTRSMATGFGFVFTLALAALRRGMLQFPLHPLGYAMVTAYGDPLWGAFLSAWIIKKGVTRIGGIGLYRQLIPMFLGITLGHFFTAGILWGILGTMGNEIFRNYGVWFG